MSLLNFFVPKALCTVLHSYIQIINLKTFKTMMGGSGMSQHMINSLRNNSRRQQRTHFDKESIYLSNNGEKKKPQFKKATQEQLLKIRKRMKRNNSVYQQKLFGYTALIMFLFISGFIIYFNHLS